MSKRPEPLTADVCRHCGNDIIWIDGPQPAQWYHEQGGLDGHEAEPSKEPATKAVTA